MGAIWAVGTEAELYDFYRSEIHYIIFFFSPHISYSY